MVRLQLKSKTIWSLLQYEAMHDPTNTSYLEYNPDIMRGIIYTSISTSLNHMTGVQIYLNNFCEQTYRKIRTITLSINLQILKFGILIRIKNIYRHKHTIVNITFRIKLCRCRTYNAIVYIMYITLTYKTQFKNIIPIAVQTRKSDVSSICCISKLRKTDSSQGNITLSNARSKTYFISIYTIDNTSKYPNLTQYKDLTTSLSINLQITLLPIVM